MNCGVIKRRALSVRAIFLDHDDLVSGVGYRRSAMMEDIANMALRHGDRRARAYERAEPVI